jgi:hypothetical protein
MKLKPGVSNMCEIIDLFSSENTSETLFDLFVSDKIKPGTILKACVLQHFAWETELHIYKHNTERCKEKHLTVLFATSGRVNPWSQLLTGMIMTIELGEVAISLHK